MSVSTLTRVQNVSLSLHPSLWSMNPNVANTWIDGCKLVSPNGSLTHPIPTLCISCIVVLDTYMVSFYTFARIAFFYF